MRNANVRNDLKRKVEETEKRNENSRQTIDRQNKLKVKDKVSFKCKLKLSIAAQFFQYTIRFHLQMSEEEEEIHVNLQDLDTYHDSDEDVNDHGWEDFFPD